MRQMRGIGVFRHGLEVEPRQGLEDLLLVEVKLHPLERGLPPPLTERRIVGVARDRLREAFVPRPLYLRKCRALLLEGLHMGGDFISLVGVRDWQSRMPKGY